MSKIIAKEVAPENIDFSFYFEDDGMKSIGGENCAVYIPGDRNHYGFNKDEYQEHVTKAESLIEAFESVGELFKTYKKAMTDNDISYTSRKCHLLKEWAKIADTSDSNTIANFLTIITGEEWNVREFCGYSQGDYCEVIYCTAHYSEESVTEIGKFWLGCGTEFSIDDCYGLYVPDDIRWKEGDDLRKYLASNYGCKPEELEIYLYTGEHVVADYKIMTA